MAEEQEQDDLSKYTSPAADLDKYTSPAPDPGGAATDLDKYTTQQTSAPATAPGTIPVQSMSNKYGLYNPVGTALDFVEEVGAAPSRTIHGASQIVHRALPWIPEVPQVQVQNSRAGGWGTGTEQGLEFLLPAGKAAELEKAGVAAASKLPGVAGAVGRTAARVGAQALPAATVTGLQTGADPDAMKQSAALAGGTAAIMPLVGKIATTILGKYTGAGPDALSRAMEGSPQLVQAMRGDITEANILQNAREAAEEFRANRASTYQQQLSNLPQGMQLDLRPAKIEFLKGLQAHNIGATVNRNTGELVLDFSRSAIRDEGAQKDLASLAHDLYDWGSKPNDLSPTGVDILKRRVDDIYTPNLKGRAIVQATKNSIRDLLNSQVPGYQTMTADYARASKFLDNLNDLSLEAKNDGTAIRKLTTLLNQNYDYRKGLIDVLSQYSPTGADLGAQISGNRLSTWAPRGIVGPIAVANAVNNLAKGRLLTEHHVAELMVLMSLGSPRIMGETANALGKVAPLAPKAAGALPSMFYVPPPPPRTTGQAEGGLVEVPEAYRSQPVPRWPEKSTWKRVVKPKVA